MVTVDCVWRKGKHLQHMNIVSDENLSRIFYVVNRQDVNGIQFLEYKKGYVVLPEFIKYEFVEFTRCDWCDVASFLGVPGLSAVGIFYESNYIYCLSFLVVYHTYCVPRWIIFYSFSLLFVQISEHKTNFLHFGSFSTKKEFLSIFRWFAESFLYFWKKKQYKKFNVHYKKFNVRHVKFSNYHINSRNFGHIEFLAAKLV